MTSLINPLLFVLLNLKIVAKKGKDYQELDTLRAKRAF